MEINEIMIKEETELTENQAKFVMVHNNILNAGAMITNSIISLSKNLKVMRDEKLYLEADCETFEDYAEKICGLKRSQAYKYIQILEKLGEEFVHSSGQIGITKLTMLSSLPEEERKTVIETVNVEDSSVNELKSKIDEITKKSEKEKANFVEKENGYKYSIAALEKELTRLKDELEKKSTQVDKKVSSSGQNAKVSLNEQNEEVEKLQEKISKLEKEIESNKNIEKIHQKTLSNYQTRVETLQKQLEINNSQELIEFKLKFDELQQNILTIKHLLSKVPEDKRENCKLALKKVVETLC